MSMFIETFGKHSDLNHIVPVIDQIEALSRISLGDVIDDIHTLCFSIEEEDPTL